MDTQEQETISSVEKAEVEGDDSYESDNDKGDLDYIFEKLVGSTGWAQWSVLIAQFFIRASGTMALFLPIFTTYEPFHVCLVSNCDSNIDTGTTIYALNVSRDLKETIHHSISTKHSNSCDKYNVLNLNVCSQNPIDETYALTCKHLVYDKMDLVETWTSKYNLVCDMKHWQKYLYVATTLGIITGLLLGGRLCDIYGRTKTMLISMVVLTPTFLFGGLSPNYAFWVYYCVLYLLSSTSTTLWICGDILSLEIFGRTHRGSVFAYNLLIEQISKLLFVAFAFWTKDWRYLHFVGGLFSLLTSAGLYFIPESVRWLISNKRLLDAEKILKTIAKKNGKVISTTMETEIRQILKKYKSKSDGKKTHIFHLFDPSHLSSTLALLISWISIFIAQSILMKQETFTENKGIFTHSLLSILIKELPCPIFLFILFKLCGRRFGLFCGQLIVGICCTILSVFGNNANQVSISIVSIVGICFSKGMLALICLITIEVYATPLRGRTIGLFMSLAKFVIILMEIWTPLNISFVSICTLPVVLTSVLAYFIPETQNVNLPLFMNDADRLNGIKRKREATAYPIDEKEERSKFRDCSNLQNGVVYPLKELIPFYALPDCDFNELKMYNMV